MSLTLTEREFQSRVIEIARLYGWKVAHFLPAYTDKKHWRTPMVGDKGFPDLVLARRGQVIFAELKAETGKLTDEQRAWLTELLGETWIGSPGYPFELADRSHRVYEWRPGDLSEIVELLSDGRAHAQ